MFSGSCDGDHATSCPPVGKDKCCDLGFRFDPRPFKWGMFSESCDDAHAMTCPPEGKDSTVI